jgi:HEPN domain-containing protein
MSDPTDPLAWVELAEQDYKTAQLLWVRRKPFYYIVCFHTQQCAEKYLKALLVQRGKEFPKVHDLVKIKSLCENAGFLVPVSDQLLQNLTMYAAEIRYPGVPASKEDAKEAIAIAKQVRHFVRKLLGMR